MPPTVAAFATAVAALPLHAGGNDERMLVASALGMLVGIAIVYVVVLRE